MAEGIIEIRFDGQRYGYWQNVSVRESVDDLCASINLGITLPGAGEALKLSANTVVEVLADGELVSTIRSGKIERDVRATDHTIQFSARSLARELVDCQYSKTLNNLKLEEVVKRICKTFNVPVKVAAKTAVVPSFSMQCETPANALINAARTANLLLYPQPDGGLILTEPDAGEVVATLVYGEHIKSYSLVDDYDMRFSEYVVKSFDYESGAALKGAVKDDGISFFRPMHIVADRHGHSHGGCDRRAVLERNRRLARAHSIKLTVQGWRHATGLWAVNTQVRVVIPHEDIDGVFLIGDRTLGQDDRGGSVTELHVMHRNAFAGEPPKKTKRSAGARR
ncbi:Phage late control gene D protein [Ferriphaselus amnicola]|uniref:Phage late control gene D protein n=1 Tax=Ferriphaselus amnicola TaxID=1188319 RepID=A0A2Z6GDY1_9PROT|nr:phage tail protein [Ferriphaselus amnicola]BBE51776.1 Phage late control gene D protein [Ferriphaselus amnicola]